MKRLLLLVLVAVLLCAFGCGSKNQSANDFKSEWRNDTIYNSGFYLPDTCVIDSDLFILTTKLFDIAQRLYVNTEMNCECKTYKTWYTSVDSFLNTNMRKRAIDNHFCFSHIIDSIIPDIRKYGGDCTAAKGQIAWLEFGINLYSMFSMQDIIRQESEISLRKKWKTENEAWLLFISKLFPLLDYEFGNATGSGAVYDVPIAFSRILQNRIGTLRGNLVDMNSSPEKSMERLDCLIANIEIRHWDWDRDILVEDSVQYSNKNSARQALAKWIDIRSDLAGCVNDKRNFNSATISLLDSISSVLNNIRH